jgi:hypothetical protein
VVAGAYTYTTGTAKHLPYAKGFIARPDIHALPDRRQIW